MSKVLRLNMTLLPGSWSGGDPEFLSASISEQGWLAIRTPVSLVLLDAQDTSSFMDWCIQSVKKREEKPDEDGAL